MTLAKLGQNHVLCNKENEWAPIIFDQLWAELKLQQ